jgi:hypothetical protein
MEEKICLITEGNTDGGRSSTPSMTSLTSESKSKNVSGSLI